MCAWCPDKKERDAAVKSQGKTPSHTICKACQDEMRIQERAFEILNSNRL